MPWGHRAIPTDRQLLDAADYVVKHWMNTPLIQRWLATQAAVAAAAKAAAEARLVAGIARLRTTSLLIGSAELVMTLGVPIAAWVGVFAALGAPYAEARALVRNEKFQSGFSMGFVMGLLGWEWQHAVSRFFKFSPDHGYSDRATGFIAANAYNGGLHAGYVHACLMNEAARRTLRQHLKSLSPSASKGQWDRDDQISYVTDLATAGRRNHLFRQ